MSDCLFCKIIDGKLQSNKVYEDDVIMAFRDRFPKADSHILVIPKKHIETLSHLEPEDSSIVSHLTIKLKDIAKGEGLAGFRTIINTGAAGGQEIFHLHYHILGGSNLPGFK